MPAVSRTFAAKCLVKIGLRPAAGWNKFSKPEPDTRAQMNSSRSIGAHRQIDSVTARIASLDFAIALLADLVQEQGLADGTKIAEIMQRAAGETGAATVVKRLSAITVLIEQSAARERRPALRIVSSTPAREALDQSEPAAPRGAKARPRSLP
jgi:hypothetical protein